MKILSLEEIEATLTFLYGNGPQTMKVNVYALAHTAREYHRLIEALKEATGPLRRIATGDAVQASTMHAIAVQALEAIEKELR